MNPDDSALTLKTFMVRVVLRWQSAALVCVDRPQYAANEVRLHHHLPRAEGQKFVIGYGSYRVTTFQLS